MISSCSSLMMETLEEAELCFPQLFNSSCKKHKRPQSQSMIIFFVMSSISLLTVFLNLLVIISISHFRHRYLSSLMIYCCCSCDTDFVIFTSIILSYCRQLHTSTNFLLLSLAVSDFFVGLLVMPFYILLSEPCWLLGDLLCILGYFVMYIITYSSTVNMFLISVDRYVAICDPLRYATKITPERVQICVFLCWIYSVFYSSLFLCDNFKQPGRYNPCYGQCVVNLNVTVDLVLCFIIPITAIIVVYMRVFVVAVSQARAMRSHITAVKRKTSGTVTVKKSELKAARTLGVVVVVFIMCYTPCYCVSLSGDDFLVGSTNVLIVFILYFNSCLNPMIYAFFYPWFRKSVKLIVTLEILQPRSCQTKIL